MFVRCAVSSGRIAGSRTDVDGLLGFVVNRGVAEEARGLRVSGPASECEQLIAGNVGGTFCDEISTGPLKRQIQRMRLPFQRCPVLIHEP